MIKLKSRSKDSCKFNFKSYADLIETVAKSEYKKVCIHCLIEYNEMLSIATQTLYQLSFYPEFEYYTESYIGTALKWSIRNELRRRYKWYLPKTDKDIIDNFDRQRNKEFAAFSQLMSVDDIVGNDESLSPQIKDKGYTPDEYAEFQELKEILEAAISSLTQKERDIVEARFFRNKKMAEISDEFDLSPSRITRIIKSALLKLKLELEIRNWH